MAHDLAKYQFTKGDPRAKEAGAKGGRNAAKNKRKMKARREIMDALLNHELTPSQRTAVESTFGDLEDDEASVFALMAAGMIKAAIDGSTSAFLAAMELADGGTSDEQQEDALSKSLREEGERL